MNWRTTLGFLLVLLLSTGGAAFGQASLTDIGGFEGTLPAFWTQGSAPTGATLSWATDTSRSMGHSLKIVKPGTTTDSAAWISENMANIWSPTFTKNVDILVGAYVKTQGVNTNPGTDTTKMWYVSYTFYDSTGAMLNETILPIDQSVASSSGWVADTNQAGETILLKDAWKLIVKFVAGKNATGTVWADDFVFYGRGTWAGQDWNTSVGVPTGWYYWLPPIGGNDGVLGNGFENTRITTEAAHSGTHSLKFDLPATRIPHDAFIGTVRQPFSFFSSDIKPGDSINVNAWIKASNLQPDSAAAFPGTWSVGITVLFFKTLGNNAGYDPNVASPDYVWNFPKVTAFDWTQFSQGVRIPDSVAGAAPAGMEIRLHVYNQMTGTIYFDDVTVTKVSAGTGTSLADIGGFEGTLPAFWTKGSAPTGAQLIWSSTPAQAHSGIRALQIDKPGTTTDSASWVSENMANIWSPTFTKNVDILVGAYIKTQGVNTNPGTDTTKMWYISYTFYDSTGALLNETILPIDQSTASSSTWMADTNQAGETILLKDAWKLIVKFVAGKNATGTVWADDFVFYGRGTWAGQDWGTNLEYPTGWYYWFPPIGGNDGVVQNGFENTVVTTETSHSGTHSLKFDLPAARIPHDAFVGTVRMPFASFASGIKGGDSISVNAWIKGSNLQPDSAAAFPGTWSVGITALFFKTLGNNAGYDPNVASPDYVWNFPKVASFDWTQFTQGVRIPDSVAGSAPTGMEIRLHVYNQMTGTIYFDDITVTKVGVVSVAERQDGVPQAFALLNNYPNPFNPSTTIRFAVPREANVSVIVYNMLGQQVRNLVVGSYAPGNYAVVWDGRDDNGLAAGSGVYFYRMNAGSTSIVKKMMLLK